MLQLDNITQAFGNKTVLSSLSFTFPARGIIALMGPSGCGKTTLLRLLARLDTPTKGQVLGLPEKVAVAFQEPRLLNWLSCEDNIKVVLSGNKLSSNLASEMLELFELSEVAEKHPPALSGGMKQRLSLARALAFDADLILLDEPFSALDAELKQRLIPRIKAHTKDKLIVFITHQIEEARAMADEIFTLSPSPVSSLLLAK